MNRLEQAERGAVSDEALNRPKNSPTLPKEHFEPLMDRHKSLMEPPIVI